MYIVGILGLIGSGKDTIGNYLVGNYGFKQDSFAGPLKDAVAAIFGWDRQLIEGKTEESRKWRDEPDLWWEEELEWQNQAFACYFPRFTPRLCLQLFGTDILRNKFHNDIWTLSLKNRLLKSGQNTVITDCRFPNECEVIRQLGGKIIRVERGIAPHWVQVIKSEIKYNPNWQEVCMEVALKHGVHASEWMSFSYREDICFENDNSIASLHAKVDHFFNFKAMAVQ